MDRHALATIYSERLPLYEALSREVEQILQHATANLRVQAMVARVKPFDSFYSKVLRKAASDPFREITDICGVRVVCLFLSDLVSLDRVIQSELDVVSIDNKIANTPDNEFGYLGIHYIVKLPADHPAASSALGNLVCEIQTRTVAMHSWATISRHLFYRKPWEIPIPLLRDFYALSGLFYLADTHCEVLLNSADTTRPDTGNPTLPGTDLDSMTSTLSAVRFGMLLQAQAPPAPVSSRGVGNGTGTAADPSSLGHRNS